MTYTSSVYTQNSATILPNTSGNHVVQLQVVATSTFNPLSVTQINLNTTGTSNPLNDISTATIYYTGTNNTFGTGTTFGTASGPNGPFAVNGTPNSYLLRNKLFLGGL